MQIADRLFHATATIEGRAVSLGSFGAPSNTWSTIASDVPLILQPEEVDQQLAQVQGRGVSLDAKAWVKGTFSPIPVSGNRLTDNQTGKLYEIVGVNQLYAANSGQTVRHHFQLDLIVIRDTTA